MTANQAQALTSVRQLDPVYVDITQSSQDLLRLRAQFTNGELRSAAEEAPVRLKLENGAMYPHEGRLQFTDVSVDESTGMVSLRALFPNPEHILLPGMYVRAVIAEGVDENACWSRSGRCGAIRRAGFRAPCGRRRQGGRPACRRGPYRGRFVAGAFRLEARRPRHC